MKRKSKYQSQVGFTLVELMITIAIIGILAGIAVPQYQNYVRRAVLVQALTVAGAMKTHAVEFYSINGRWASEAESYEILNIGSWRDLANGDVNGAFFDNRGGVDGQVYVNFNGSSIGVSGVPWLRIWLSSNGATITADMCNDDGSHPTEASIREYLDC